MERRENSSTRWNMRKSIFGVRAQPTEPDCCCDGQYGTVHDSYGPNSSCRCLCCCTRCMTVHRPRLEIPDVDDSWLDDDEHRGEVWEQAHPWYLYNELYRQQQQRLQPVRLPPAQPPAERPDYELRHYEPGVRLLVETHSKRVYDCTYVKTQRQAARIAVWDVSELFPKDLRPGQGQSPNGILYFYSNEIRSLHWLYDEEHRHEQEHRQERQHSLASPPLDGLSYQQFLRGLRLMRDCQYIPVCDIRCVRAIQEIKNRDVIGIVALGSHVVKVRVTNISFFIVSTVTQIYLFDIELTPKHFWESGLREILESKRIQKVCYDSKILGDLLYNRYWRIQIANVFDVQMADFVISKKYGDPMPEKDLRSFPQLAEKYLHLPPPIFCDSEWLMMHRLHYKRPANVQLQRRCALCATFLVPLRNTQRALLLAIPGAASQAYSDSLASRAPSCSMLLKGSQVPDAVRDCLQHPAAATTAATTTSPASAATAPTVNVTVTANATACHSTT